MLVGYTLYVSYMSYSYFFIFNTMTEVLLISYIQHK